MKDKKQLKASLAALITNVIFGFSFLFSKVALSYSHPLVILAVRFTVAFAVLSLLWAIGVFKMSFKGKARGRILLMALAQPVCYYVFELYGIKLTSSALSGVIISLVPVVVIILATVFLRERPTLRQVLFSALSLGAIAVISVLSNDGAQNTFMGILLLLGAVLCASVFNVLSRKESKEYSPIERTYIMFLAGSVGFNLIAAATLGKSYVTEIISASVHIEFWGAIAYLAIASSIIAFLLYNYSTTILPPVKSASYSNLITVVSVLAGIFILGEILSPLQLVLCAAVIIGVLGVNR
jgi:drug/metabolite transporter (DMT)-like permease